MEVNILRNIYRIDTLLSCCEDCLRPSSTAQYSAVFWVLTACGDCNTSLSGNNTSHLAEKKKAEKFQSHTNTFMFHWLMLLLIHELSLSCQNWFIRTNVVKTWMKVICIIQLNHRTRNQCFLINSEGTQNMAISLAIIIAVYIIPTFLVGSNSSQSLLPLILRWPTDEIILTKPSLHSAFFLLKKHTKPKSPQQPMENSFENKLQCILLSMPWCESNKTHKTPHPETPLDSLIVKWSVPFSPR